MHGILIYGQGGVGKTPFVPLLAQQFLKPGQKIKLVTAENTHSIQEHIASGLVEMWHVTDRPHPFYTLERACDGYWPVDPSDPTSKLVAPTAADWEKYPFRVFEGMATFGEYLASGHVVGGMAQRKATGQSIGRNDAESIRFSDGADGEEVEIGGLTQTAYGVLQDELLGLVQRSQRTPASHVVWTSHDRVIYKKILVNGKPAQGPAVKVGPEVYGEKLTHTIHKQFADCWRIQAVNVVTDGRLVVDRRLFVKPHICEENKVPAIVKNSAGLKELKYDYFGMSDEKGQPRMDVAERVVRGLWR